MGLLMGSIYWIIERRRKVALQEGHGKRHEKTEGGGHDE
jgi:hypothetical protein